MSWLDWLFIIGCLWIGYGLVSVIMNRSNRKDDYEVPSPDHGEPTMVERKWHEVLGVAQTAADEEIVAAYRAKAAQYHPDKVATMGSEIRVLAALKMSEINAAWQQARKRR